MVAPNSIGITRSLVRELTAEQGIDAYHGAQWRTRIAERLTAETEYGGATELRAEEGVEGTEVLAKEIRPVTLKLEVNKDFREWEHYLSKCMRTHGARPRLCGRNTRVPRLARWLASLPGARVAAQGKSKRC